MGFGENILGAAWTTVGEDANVSLVNMNGGSGLNWLLLGFANLIWVPTAMKIGRKFVYIASLIIMVCMYSWSAVFYGTGQWYGSCALGGLGTSAYQALIQLTIMDIFFAHERGTMLAVYVWSQQLGALLGSILGGYIAAGPGWRFGEDICAILCAFVAVLIFFTMDDSMFPRDAFTSSTNSLIPSAASDSDVVGSEDLSQRDAKTKNMQSSDQQVVPTEGLVTLPPRTYLGLLSPIHYYKEDSTTFYQYFRRPFVLFSFPNVVLSAIIFGFACTGGFASFSTMAEILMAPPYNWGTGPTGLVNLAGLIGSFIGMATGYLGDRLVIYLARKNGGYKEPEMRLWMLGSCFIYTGIGYMTYGWVAQEGEHWIGIAIGLACMSAQQTAAGSIATAYAMECFEGIAGEIVVILAIGSSVINFACSYSIQPMINVMGYGWALTAWGLMALLSLGLAIPMMLWGKEWRRAKKERYDAFLRETGRA
ncbi:hypothetical protein BP6252_04507 [Coleophoma cylindrospora]|uniref:Major facilitator superfamily (MFS) profile domain-containing protein n=1 Tax=Coleophoma cylindrospora TaxID=1849047 RepID=A0A3D8S0P2_9HELO|nr:hypothetical protein BP6252_04507 [Coleophoma cylindrospora]